jgi:hypothetical protein
MGLPTDAHKPLKSKLGPIAASANVAKSPTTIQTPHCSWMRLPIDGSEVAHAASATMPATMVKRPIAPSPVMCSCLGSPPARAGSLPSSIAAIQNPTIGLVRAKARAAKKNEKVSPSFAWNFVEPRADTQHCNKLSTKTCCIWRGAATSIRADLTASTSTSEPVVTSAISFTDIKARPRILPAGTISLNFYCTIACLRLFTPAHRPSRRARHRRAGRRPRRC